MSVLQLLRVAPSFLGAAGCLALAVSPRFRALAGRRQGLAYAAALSLTASLALRWVATGQPPVFGAYDNALGAASLGALLLATAERGSFGSSGRLVSPLFAIWPPAALAVGTVLGAGGSGAPVSGWGWIAVAHALLYWLTVDALVAAGGAAAVLLRLPKNDAAAAGSDRDLTEHVLRGVGLGLALLTLTLAAGAFTSYLTGSPWFVWSVPVALLVGTWLLYAIAVHSALSFGLEGEGLAVMALSGLPFALFAFWTWSVSTGVLHHATAIATGRLP